MNAGAVLREWCFRMRTTKAATRAERISTAEQSGVIIRFNREGNENNIGEARLDAEVVHSR